MTEIFKTINGWPDYQISNTGRVYSKRFNRYLKPSKTEYGREQVVLCAHGIIKSFKIHILLNQYF